MKIVLCYRSGGLYDSHDVRTLCAQIALHARYPVEVLTDRPDEGLFGRPHPFQYDWSGWWCKMELFDPSFSPSHNLLYFDLDTMLVDDLQWLISYAAGTDTPTLLRDFYRPKGLQSSVMMIPAWLKPIIWRTWLKDPKGWMREFAEGGDQVFLEMQLRRFPVNIWQDLFPGKFVSYKATMNQGPVPPDAAVVVFHGLPKPRDIQWKLDMRLKGTAGNVDTCGPLTTLSAQPSSSTPSTETLTLLSGSASTSES